MIKKILFHLLFNKYERRYIISGLFIAAKVQHKFIKKSGNNPKFKNIALNFRAMAEKVASYEYRKKV